MPEDEGPKPEQDPSDLDAIEEDVPTDEADDPLEDPSDEQVDQQVDEQVDEQADEPPVPLEPAEPTGHPAVDTVLADLDGLEDRPVHEHVAAFEAAHAGLRRALDASDAPEGADGPDDTDGGTPVASAG